ncbi:cellulose binding domain-containing protein [Sphaerisporangium fuscum]|uniref:cellulose binding domain-containing protein n=1 Tax=Sphaerisporangium fuscum TaxID=2835868 RepID=UPI001BDBF02E|nr:cellulose binding domain-containing protein [Sphaerisporangium fuscum]
MGDTCQAAEPARRRRRWWPAALLATSLVTALLVAQPATTASAVADPPAPVTGNATYFDGLGSPYGGCGLPQPELESQDFVALNVFNTPGDYGNYPRPLPASMSSKIGMWNNGLNCGRWVRVSISDYCTGVNDGAPGQAFCRNGSWVGDAYNGATLTMLVADSCGDANAWCRDDPYHLDLAKNSLNRFVRNGGPVGDMYPGHWNNRHITWSFVPAPDYTGDIRIGFLQGAQRYWPAIAVSHLANGIHGVEYLADGVWKAAQMNGDMGQSYIIAPTVSGGTQYQIRVRDVSDALVNGGRVYSFSLPSSCGPCGAAYTGIAYTTGTSTPGPPPTPTPTPTVTPTPGACSASYTKQSEWQGGFNGQISLTNRGAALTGWTVTFTVAPGVTVSGWNGVWTQSGTTVTVKNASWNGNVAAGGVIDLGFTASATGAASAPSGFTLNGAACA